MRQSLRMLARDWRAGELRVLATALAIAVAAITSVVPYSRFISNSSRITSAPESASRLPVGSSASRSLGRTTKARASATRCCSPPERCLG